MKIGYFGNDLLSILHANAKFSFLVKEPFASIYKCLWCPSLTFRTLSADYVNPSGNQLLASLLGIKEFYVC